MVKKTEEHKATNDKPPACWISKQPAKPKKKLYGIWRLYTPTTKAKIEKICVKEKEEKRKGAKKREK